jgi:hypothetical protein
MSPISPPHTPSCSPSVKISTDPFGGRSPSESVRTSSNGISTEHRMRFDAFNSPVIQQQCSHPSATKIENATPHQTNSNSSSLPAGIPYFPIVYPGLSSMPLQGSALMPDPSLPVQSRISANPFDQPTSLIFGGREFKSFSSPGGPALYGHPAPPQSRYPNPSYPPTMPYYQSPRPGTGPSPGLGYGMGEGTGPGPSPGPGPSHMQGLTPAHTLPTSSQQLFPQHYQQQQQRNGDQRQYEQTHPVPYIPPVMHPQGQTPPNYTPPGILSPGSLRAPAPVDPFSSVDALGWGLGVKKNDPYATLEATPLSVIHSPSYTQGPRGLLGEVCRPHTYTHAQPTQQVTSSPAALSESTNPFDLY